MRGDRVSTPQLRSQQPRSQQPQSQLQPQQSQRARRWPAPSPLPLPLPSAAYPDWEAIYADNVGRIYRLMFSKVGNRPDAEDLTSQVFLTAYGPLRATAGVAQVRAYLTATARTVLADHWRRTLGHQVTEIDLETTDLENCTGAGAGPGTSVGGGLGAGTRAGESAEVEGFGADESGTADERAARILEALPQRQRQILVLRFLRGYTIRQAAAELGVTVANAKVMQHRALRAAARLDESREVGDQGSSRQARDQGLSREAGDRGLNRQGGDRGLGRAAGDRGLSREARDQGRNRGVKKGYDKDSDESKGSSKGSDMDEEEAL